MNPQTDIVASFIDLNVLVLSPWLIRVDVWCSMEKGGLWRRTYLATMFELIKGGWQTPSFIHKRTQPGKLRLQR